MGDQALKDNAKNESYTPKPITYNTNLEKLLKENSEECESLSILHRMSYEKYNTRSNYINIPVIILSSAIGFITGIDLQYDQMNIILGVGSVFVGIIKSVDTYFQLAKRAESHRICSLQFSQISKKMQVELTLHRNQRMTAENMMNIIKTDIKNMQDIAPLIDDDIINMYNAKYRKYKRVKKPNFVNGLTDVVVNSNNNEYEYEFSSRHGSREGSLANTQVQNTIPSHDPEYDQQIQTQTQAINNTTSVSNMNDVLFNGSNRQEEDDDSVDPIQPTIIQTVNNTNNMNNTNNTNNTAMKSGGSSLNRKMVEMSAVPSGPLQTQQPIAQIELLQLLSQLQQQGIGTGLAGINVLSSPVAQPQQSVPSQHSKSPSFALAQTISPSETTPQTNDVIISIDEPVNDVIRSVSPSGSNRSNLSNRSNSSIPIGTIQTDSNGNQIVNT
jgi:hypothetical protein